MGRNPVQVDTAMTDVMPILVLPIATVTALKLLHYGITTKSFAEIAPLLIVQLNSVFVWTTQGMYIFYRVTDDTSFKQLTIHIMLGISINLGPMNTFFYTWRFLDSLESEQSETTKKACSVFKYLSLIVVPAMYLSLYFAIALVGAKFSKLYYEDGNYQYYKLFQVYGYWSTITNIAACFIMGLVVRFVNLITKKPKDMPETIQDNIMQEQVKMNLIVTLSHIAIIVAYTLVLFINDNFSLKLP